MRRREILKAAPAVLAATALSASAASAGSAAQPFGRSVADFGVRPDTQDDQTEALQRALDEIAGAGQPAFLPPGRYKVKTVSLAPITALFGVPGFSIFIPAGDAPCLSALKNVSIRLTGLGFDGQAGGGASKAKSPALEIAGGSVLFDRLTFENTAGDALVLEGCSGDVTETRITGSLGSGLLARAPRALAVRNCVVSRCGQNGIACGQGPGGLMQIVGNRVSEAQGAGLAIEGDAVVSGNIAERCERFGLRLGGALALGTFTAVNNVIRSAPIGIGVSASGDGYGVISLNMIVGARNGAIRALDGGNPVGPDLAKSSAEAFRSLAVAGNVAL